MLNTIAIAFYFVLPAYFANMCPVLFGKLGLLKFLAKPVDGGRKLNGQEIFGSHKTWRGLIAAVIGGLIITFIQLLLFSVPYFHDLSVVNYPDQWIIFGALGGGGAIIGDLIKSFFKRRVGIKPGRTWLIFDQLDFILGFFLFTVWITNPGLTIIATVLLMTLLLHPLANILGKLLGLKKTWF